VRKGVEAKAASIGHDRSRIFSAIKTRASSKVAITGGAIRRPSWHWRVLSMFKRRTALATG
jgi:hypothetical protein